MSDILKVGSTGESVKLLQKALNFSMGLNLVVDGGFGNGTANALKAWQTANKLAPTGIYSIQEMAILEPLIDTKFLSSRVIEGFAPSLGVNAAVLKAFTDVESKGAGFLANKKPVILFERHVFYREVAKLKGDATAKEFQVRDPSICHPSWDKSVYLGGMREYERLDKAINFNKTAALKATSWGLFQIMGNNHVYCGYTEVDTYVGDAYISETMQFKALLSFLKNYPVKVRGKTLLQAARDLDFVTLAEIYNGSGYAANQYDVKLKKAFDFYNK